MALTYGYESRNSVNVSTFRYSMSFTSAALAYREAVVVAETYHQLGNWEATRDTIVAENLLQMRTQNASKRICREIISRLRLLTPAELALVIDGTRLEQNYVLWLAVCKRYRFIYDFAVEVLREKFLRFSLELTYDDYDTFFNAKAEWHPEVERIPSGNRKKQRQFVFRMLRDAELLSGESHILPALFTPRIAAALQEDNPIYFTIYPVSDFDIREWIK
jgi:hypothetical protein